MVSYPEILNSYCGLTFVLAYFMLRLKSMPSVSKSKRRQMMLIYHYNIKHTFLYVYNLYLKAFFFFGIICI
jgi:hypothetical protein